MVWVTLVRAASESDIPSPSSDSLPPSPHPTIHQSRKIPSEAGSHPLSNTIRRQHASLRAANLALPQSRKDGPKKYRQGNVFTLYAWHFIVFPSLSLLLAWNTGYHRPITTSIHLLITCWTSINPGQFKEHSAAAYFEENTVVTNPVLRMGLNGPISITNTRTIPVRTTRTVAMQQPICIRRI